MLSAQAQTKGTVTDAEENVYQTVTINDQVRMGENLKTTKYNDGSSIEFPGSDAYTWYSNTNGGYAWYNDDINNKSVYGALYNWHAVNSNKLCPTGWHVPSYAEWSALNDFVETSFDAGIKLKATSGWPDGQNGTNDFGFAALPGGKRSSTGSYSNAGAQGYWWKATEHSSTKGKNAEIYGTQDYLDLHYASKDYGFAVRCVFETTEDLSAWSYLDVNNEEDYWGITSEKGIDGTACASYSYNDVNAANDWLFTPCFDMEAGKKYRISFSYAVAGSTFPEKLASGCGSSADVTEGTAPLTVKFTDLSTGNPTAWAWDFKNDGTFDSYEQNPTYTYTTPGTFSVKLVAATSTQENGITINGYFSVNPVGINDAVNNALFTLYPNPSNGMAYLKLTEYTGALNIEVMDLAGKTVFLKSENYLAEAIIPIDLKATNTGIYFIKRSTDRGVSMKKLIIE